MNRFPILASLLVIITSCCCCSWEAFTQTILESLNTSVNVTEDQFVQVMTGKNALPNEIQAFQGVAYEFPGFTNYYLLYEVDDKEWLLDWVESLPAGHSIEIKPEQMVCEKAFESSVYEDFFPTVDDLSQVEFWHPEQIADKEYYTCLRFPWSHSLLFDKVSKMVYHVIRETRD